MSNTIDKNTGNYEVYELVDTKEDPDEEESVDPAIFEEMMKKYNEQTKATAEETEEINQGSEDDPRLVRISSALNSDERVRMEKLLKRYVKILAFSYEEMPRLQSLLVEHRLPLKPGAKTAKQKLRRLRPDLALKVKEEIDKLHKAKFIRVVVYPEWIVNIVPVMKKDGKVRVCIDYKNLNEACPKDDFPLSHIDILIDNTAGHEMLSFMDGFSGYNQIKLAEEDQEKSSFTTP